MINKGGIKISSIQIENLLRDKNPGINCIVGPVFSKKYGEDIGLICEEVMDLTQIEETMRPRVVIINKIPKLKSSLKLDRQFCKNFLWQSTKNNP